MADKWIWIAAAAGGAFVLYEWFKQPSATALQVSPFPPSSPGLPVGSIVTGGGDNPQLSCGAGTVWDAGSHTCIPGPILPPPPIHPPNLPATCTTPECAQPPNIPHLPIVAVTGGSGAGMQGLDGCYDWTKSCFEPPDPCGGYGPAEATCAPTVTWYWVLAGAVAASLVLARFR